MRCTWMVPLLVATAACSSLHSGADVIETAIEAPDAVEAAADASPEALPEAADEVDPPCPAEALVAAAPGLVRVAERRLLDPGGREVYLRGINCSELIQPDDAMFEGMAYFGFNALRMVLGWDLMEPEKGVYDEAYYQRVDQVVELARAHGVRVLLDMHQGFWWWMPPWTCEDPPDGFDLDKTCACARAFYQSDELKAHFHEAWRRLAERYPGDPIVLGLDLFNEPPPTDMAAGITGTFDRDVLAPFYDQLIATVRSVDADHAVFLEPNFGAASGVSSFEVPFADPQVVYAPHLYAPHGAGEDGWHFTVTPTVALLDYQLGNMLKVARRLDAPLFLGEWGFIQEDPDPEDWVNAFLDRVESERVSSTIWLVGKHGTDFSVFVRDETTGAYAPTEWFRQRLLRAFPAAVAAREWAFATTGPGQFTLTLQVGPQDRCRTTEVVVPAALFHNLPQVTIQAGTADVRHDPATQRLLIAPRCAACTVSLDVE